ncbi:cilia- and flagella-associated protein 90-like [Lineus longissimus]|uniref:cilia- and flagella-associated protein 90-like n=1 Tax=Lineus longissimus TaxID=88925 RepID=UPI002B4F853B
MEEEEHIIHVETPTDVYNLKGRPCELSAYSFVPTHRQEPKERVFFNSDKKDRYTSSTYDRLFKQEEGYNNKLHRCDREHAKSRGLVVNSEEKIKIVPSLASTEYGHRLDKFIDHPDRKNARIAIVQQDFYRRNGIPSTGDS